MLDEHYGMVRTINALSKELYSLNQGSGEYVAKFGVHLSQQAQIPQLEYLGRIQQEHIEEMKWDHFYDSPSPKYWHMLAHKVDGEHPTSYSNLLQAAQKLERQIEARDHLFQRTTTTGASNVTIHRHQGIWRWRTTIYPLLDPLWWKALKLKKTGK